MDIRSLHIIETPENLGLEIELAGIGNRIFAYLLDIVFLGILLVLAFITKSFVARIEVIGEELGKVLDYLLPFLLMFGYFLVQEWLTNGRTLGKSLVGIRVVRQNGQPIGFWESMGRNLVRLIDGIPLGIGLVAMLFSKSEQRFGDLLCGTIVINDQKIQKPFQKTVPIPPGASDWVTSYAQSLSPQEYEILGIYLDRKKHLFQNAQTRLEADMLDYLQERFHLSDEQRQETSLIERFYQSYH